jgi:LytS/YehU family sensor histidine kinase
LLSMPFYLSLGWFDQQSKIDKLESVNLRTELDSLKDQINPHFFFNTLNNLYSLTLTNSAKAPEAILKLSGLMRYVIHLRCEQTICNHPRRGGLPRILF